MKLNNLFKKPETRFFILCGVKVASVYLLTIIIVTYLFWLIISLNNIFFEAQGLLRVETVREAFFDHAFSTVNDKWPFILGGLISLFFLGMYIGAILLRPFKLIGDYAKGKANGENVSYNPNLFSDYKLLTRFSEFFFTFLNVSTESGELQKTIVPAQFDKIKTPIFERVFFFHFLIFIGVIVSLTISFSFMLTTEIQAQIIDLSANLFQKGDNSISYFLSNQKEIFNSINYFVVVIIIMSYIGLSLHFYSKVSRPIFAFFLTMRSYIKGNCSARVHLIGYPHIRENSRLLNKYLDCVERDFSQSKSKVSSLNKKKDKNEK